MTVYILTLYTGTHRLEGVMPRKHLFIWCMTGVKYVSSIEEVTLLLVIYIEEKINRIVYYLRVTI